MVKTIFIGLAIVVVVFAFVVALQPSDFRIVRSAAIAAPAAAVFSQVNDFHQVFEADDFGPALTPELRDAEERLRDQAVGRRQA